MLLGKKYEKGIRKQLLFKKRKKSLKKKEEQGKIRG
jgi:hypothetical protein